MPALRFSTPSAHHFSSRSILLSYLSNRLSMANPQCLNLAKSVLLKRLDRQRFDSADWAMNLPANREQGDDEASSTVHETDSPKTNTAASSPVAQRVKP
ncbi:hypothetical protein SPRG_17915 [Saprolegnia parasitica CBS 223.65]|uniref:Uncharacterized protein n=1 Tax=Saprolegnia parasitica (strain CBS 223.65) TaxID=695850 RepID=A0A067BQI4_SAPPC|nr:hypothetical protein SPRG_17915 [Saprolegnia parasitica CBS 223.65]KDO16576.1 hypothetical protein SPRG_17915 [Saprolegnia parasitica CBS 223.65]|eukprot:XP_012212717.1 hypothetical protein SPRG_17915 [Saprolegnia parasitica CBS 223.65]